MPVFKDEKTNKWYAMVRFTDWQGQRRQKCKRGFAMRRDALEWEKVRGERGHILPDLPLYYSFRGYQRRIRHPFKTEKYHIAFDNALSRMV